MSPDDLGWPAPAWPPLLIGGGVVENELHAAESTGLGLCHVEHVLSHPGEEGGGEEDFPTGQVLLLGHPQATLQPVGEGPQADQVQVINVNVFLFPHSVSISIIVDKASSRC